MNNSKHEEIAKLINEIFGNDFDWFICYAEHETGNGMTFKKGDETEIGKTLYSSIMVNYRPNEPDNAAMRMYNILESAMVNLITNNDALKKSFFESLNRAKMYAENRSNSIKMAN